MTRCYETSAHDHSPLGRVSGHSKSVSVADQRHVRGYGQVRLPGANQKEQPNRADTTAAQRASSSSDIRRFRPYEENVHQPRDIRLSALPPRV